MWAPHVRVSALAPFLFPQFSTFLLSLSPLLSAGQRRVGRRSLG
ncbi:hypothetical protein EE612_025690 [Oryza sativa]|nr:hypothetical protein EE612_025690 [Oryza sativa]